jgi:monoamine oxidase
MRTVVIGAGLSGLTAALRLEHAGVDLLVLEARDRVGGRAWRAELDGGLAWDAGCQVLDEAHTALITLAAEAGVGVYHRHGWALDGMSWLIGGQRTDDPPLAPDELALFRALGEEVGRLAARIDPAHPGDVEDAGRLDYQTLAGWLRERGASSRLLAIAEAWYSTGSSSVPIEEMSLLAYAAKHAAGAGGPLDVRLEGGPGTLARRLAALLGGRVELGVRAVAVEEAVDAVEIRCANGRVERAERAIVALPLNPLSEIRFTPGLTESKRRALAEARYGDVVKAVLTLPAPAPVNTLTDRAYLVSHDERDDAIIAFCASRPAVRLASLAPGERDDELARLAGAALGTDGVRMRHAVAWTNEPLTRGSYLIFGPGHLLDWGRRLPEPHGRVHFAGSEASDLPSYMEGAVRAGERAAGEVLAAG